MDKSIDHIGACERSSAVSNRDSWPLASAGGGHLNGEVEGNFTFRSPSSVSLGWDAVHCADAFAMRW